MLPEQFWDNVEKSEECWEWKKGLGSKSKPKHQYGRAFVLGIVSRGAHRVAWELSFGGIPKGLQVLHKCDNPKCVRPDHLFLGTHADNMKDKGKKGRISGERNPSAKYSDELIKKIKEAEGTYYSIAKKFGVSITYAKELRLNLYRTI